MSEKMIKLERAVDYIPKDQQSDALTGIKGVKRN